MKNFFLCVFIFLAGAVTGLVAAHCPKVQQFCPVMNRCGCQDGKCCPPGKASVQKVANCQECNCPCAAGEACTCAAFCSCNKGVSCPGKKPKTCKNCEKK